MPSNGHENNIAVVISISSKIGFKSKLIRKVKEVDYILLKGKIHLEDTETVNISASKIRTIKFIKGTLLQLKSYIDSQVLMVVDFNNPLFAIAWSSMPKTKQRNVGYNGCYKPIVPSS